MSSSKPLQLVYSYVWGDAYATSFDGFNFYVIFVDHYIKYIWLYSIRHKYDVLSIFIKFITLVEKFFQLPLIFFYSDNREEFQKLKTFLKLMESIIFYNSTHSSTKWIRGAASPSTCP